MRDSWAEADHYEAYMGRWSRLVAEAFLDWLAPRAGLSWMDVGCGTGALTHAIARRSPRFVTGMDRSQQFVMAAGRDRQSGSELYVVADAAELPVAGGSVDLAVSALALNFLPQPERMVREMARAVRHGGRAALYVWDYAGGMEYLRHFWDAVADFEPAAANLDEGRRFPICRAEVLEQIFASTGLRDVTVMPIDVSMRFRNFEGYWSSFSGGQGPAPGYVSKLGEKDCVSLRELLRQRLPEDADQSIALTARAWAVQGHKVG